MLGVTAELRQMVARARSALGVDAVLEDTLH